MSFFSKAHLKWFGVWWLIGWAWVALVWYLSLTSRPLDIDLGTEFNDKIGHFIAYTWLMFWFANLYHCRHGRLSYAAIFIAMGILLEGIQSLSIARQLEIYDMLANTLGVITGYLLSLGKSATLLMWFENLLINKQS